MYSLAFQNVPAREFEDLLRIWAWIDLNAETKMDVVILQVYHENMSRVRVLSFLRKWTLLTASCHGRV
jgi:hypothetical protein